MELLDTIAKPFRQDQRPPWLLPLLVFIVLLQFVFLAWSVYGRLQTLDQNKFLLEESQHRDEKDSFQNRLIRTQADSIGRLIHTLQVTETTKEQVEGVMYIQDNFIKKTLLALAADQKELRQITMATDKAVKNIKQVTNLKIESNADILTILRDTILEGHLLKNIKDSIRIDTQRVYARTFEFAEKEGWFTVSGLVTQDSISIKIKKWKDEIVKADFRQPANKPKLLPRFLRRKVTVTKVKSLNPYSSLKNFQQVNISDK